MSRAIRGFSKRFLIVSDNIKGSSSTKYPVFPSTIVSLYPPSFIAIIGTAQAIASRGIRPKGSLFVNVITIRELLYSLTKLLSSILNDVLNLIYILGFFLSKRTASQNNLYLLLWSLFPINKTSNIFFTSKGLNKFVSTPK